MRVLGDTLTAAQLAMGDAKCKIILSSGSTIKGYDIDSTTDRILNLRHTEQEWSQTAAVTVQDSDATLAALDLRGYKGIISYGYYTGKARTAWVVNHGYNLGDFVIPTTANANGYQYKCTTAGTSHATTEPSWGTSLGGTTAESGGPTWTLDGNAGDEYSSAAPLWVVAQRTDSTGGSIRTTFELKGIFDFMADDKASKEWSASDNYVTTVEKILNFVTYSSYTFFDHCTARTLTIDSRDTGAGAVNVYAPKDYFSVGINESRLSVLKKLIGWVGVKLRVEADEAIHMLVPEDTNAEYDYEDVTTEHNFFSKAVRKAMVIPNYIIVSSHPDHEDSYSDEKHDSTNDGGMEIRSHHYIRAVSDAQCKAIATSILKHHQLEAERGSGYVPMNCGQEVMDYVKITDSRVGDTRSGNVGYIIREYVQNRRPYPLTMRFGFGRLMPSVIRGMPLLGEGDLSVTVDSLIDAYEGLRLDLYELLQAYSNIVDYLVDTREVVPKWHITEQAIMPVWIPGAPVVTTEAVSSIGSTTATGNWTIDKLGVPDATQHGVCYNTTGSPNIVDDTVKQEGVPSGEGAFTSAMTGLSSSTLHYLRAYATNSTGTGYGAQVTFTTEAA